MSPPDVAAAGYRRPSPLAVESPAAAAAAVKASERRFPLDRSGNRVAKRVMDATIALLALTLALPLMTVITILVKVGGPGPVIFRRRVAGRHGIRFDAFKFRTMMDGADAMLAEDSGLKEAFDANYKLESDPRVTPVGRVLRKFSLDELPQLWNVLRGQMSIVGPRMLSPEELSRYGERLSTVLAVKPGLTGPWQVSGRHRTPYARRVELDVQYVEQWSLLRDLRILLRTPFVVLKGTGI